MDAKELPAQPALNEYEKLAEDFLNAYNTGDPDALLHIRDHYSLERTPTIEEVRVRAAQRLRRLRGTAGRPNVLELGDARDLIADSHCFENWLT